jgi:xylulokinase
MLMYGSTMFLVAVVQHPSRERSIWTTRGVDPGSLTLAAGLATSGSLVSWCRELLGGVEYDELLSEARSTPAGAAGLLVLPYFAGERTPILDPRARGAILGLTLQHTRGHLCRAIIEGIAYGVRHNLEAMDPLGIAHARAVGGGTRSRFWVQTVSDICGLAQSIPAETIGASYGDARLAAEGVGLVGSDTSWTRPCETLQPDLTTAELYDEFYDYYKQLYPATREIAHALAGIQERVPGAAHSAESPSIRSAT